MCRENLAFDLLILLLVRFTMLIGLIFSGRFGLVFQILYSCRDLLVLIARVAHLILNRLPLAERYPYPVCASVYPMQFLTWGSLLLVRNSMALNIGYIAIRTTIFALSALQHFCIFPISVILRTILPMTSRIVLCRHHFLWIKIVFLNFI